jgi:NAD(P)H-hydrate repair Nnr-like enzyme with NAD(P)H-hydrate dehydratase domain
LTAFDAACVGAYLAGTSAELVAAEKGEYAMLPRDVIEKLPTAFLTIENQA